MRRAIVVIAALGVVLTARVTAQAPGGAQKSLRLYVLDCGVLLNRDPSAYDLTREQVDAPDMSDPCFLLVHPRGTLLWETGIDDRIDNRPARFRSDRIAKPLKAQLADLGFKPTDITYLAVSHVHGDHIGNANDYASATWIVQSVERDFMFGAQAAANINPDEFSKLRDSKTIALMGDHDVFGDGSVMVVSTPGHTPGHQSLFVKLARTGGVMLTGDLYHYPAERTLNKFPRADNIEQTKASRARIETMLQKTGAQLWIQHDFTANKKLKKSPEYYD
jgi:N-acyl homoserine lactone hydrolase